MEQETKIEYFCINPSNEFKIMDDMHRAIILNNFQKAVHGDDETKYQNVFNIFFNKIVPIKSSMDLYAQNISLLEKYLSMNEIKEIKDISKSMNFLMNYNFKGEFCLTKEIAENIATILFYGFAKLKSKFKFYMIKSYADFKEKIERLKFQQYDLLTEYYNQELLEKPDKQIPKYVYRKDPYVTNDGKVYCQENKLQYVKTLTFNIEDIYNGPKNNQNSNNNLDIIIYLMILINVEWLLPNILVVNFDLTNNALSNALIDIMSLKLKQELQGINIFERKTVYKNNQIPYSKIYNFEMMIKYKEKEIQDKENLNRKFINIFQIYRKKKRDRNQVQAQNNNNNPPKKPENKYNKKK